MNLRRHHPDTRCGTIILMLAIGMTFFIASMTIAIDILYVYFVNTTLVTAVDASVLAAVRSIGRGSTQAEQQAEVQRVAMLLLNANFPEGHLLTNTRTASTAILRDGERPGTREVEFSVSVDVPTIFYRWFSGGDVGVGARSRAIRRDVNLMLVLDRSGSLDRAAGANPGPTAFNDVQFAATEFVDKFDNIRDQLGVVSFGTTTNLDFAPAANFKGPITAQINAMVADGSGTNLADGLWQGYNALNVLGVPNAPAIAGPINTLSSPWISHWATGGVLASRSLYISTGWARMSKNSSVPRIFNSRRPLICIVRKVLPTPGDSSPSNPDRIASNGARISVNGVRSS